MRVTNGGTWARSAPSGVPRDVAALPRPESERLRPEDLDVSGRAFRAVERVTRPLLPALKKLGLKWVAYRQRKADGGRSLEDLLHDCVRWWNAGATTAALHAEVTESVAAFVDDLPAGACRPYEVLAREEQRLEFEESCLAGELDRCGESAELHRAIAAAKRAEIGIERELVRYHERRGRELELAACARPVRGAAA